MERKHTISILVENEFGVLARVAGLFSSKGYNIDSLSVSATLDPSLSRMTILTHGSDRIIEQILKQLNKLVNVIHVDDVTEENYVMQEMIVVKLKRGKTEMSQILPQLNGALLENVGDGAIVEITGSEKQLDEALEKLKPFDVVDLVRTGVIAIRRGETPVVKD